MNVSTYMGQPTFPTWIYTCRCTTICTCSARFKAYNPYRWRPSPNHLKMLTQSYLLYINLCHNNDLRDTIQVKKNYTYQIMIGTLKDERWFIQLTTTIIRVWGGIPINSIDTLHNQLTPSKIYIYVGNIYTSWPFYTHHQGLWKQMNKDFS